MMDKFIRINNDIKHFKIVKVDKIADVTKIKVESEKPFKFEAA